MVESLPPMAICLAGLTRPESSAATGVSADSPSVPPVSPPLRGAVPRGRASSDPGYGAPFPSTPRIGCACSDSPSGGSGATEMSDNISSRFTSIPQVLMKVYAARLGDLHVKGNTVEFDKLNVAVQTMNSENFAAMRKTHTVAADVYNRSFVCSQNFEAGEQPRKNRERTSIDLDE
jgi:hypothetical protein